MRNYCTHVEWVHNIVCQITRTKPLPNHGRFPIHSLIALSFTVKGILQLSWVCTQEYYWKHWTLSLSLENSWAHAKYCSFLKSNTLLLHPYTFWSDLQLKGNNKSVTSCKELYVDIENSAVLKALPKSIYDKDVVCDTRDLQFSTFWILQNS